MSEKIWTCKIGAGDVSLPPGADGPMRQAVAKAFKEMTGKEARFCFSGWGGELTEPERAVVENRLPSLPSSESKREEPCECYATGDYPCRVCAGAKDEPKCLRHDCDEAGLWRRCRNCRQLQCRRCGTFGGSETCPTCFVLCAKPAESGEKKEGA